MEGSTRRRAVFAGLGLAGAAGLLTVGLLVPGAAFAEDPTPTPTASAPAPAKPEREARREARQDELAEALAKELGIDKEKVAAALDKVGVQMREKAKAERLANLKTRLDAAVAEGKLTREQADAILKAAEQGVLRGLHHKRGGARGGPPR